VDLAFTPDDLRLAPLQSASREYGLTLIVGAPARIGSKCHIGAFILRSDGAIEIYTKRRLGAFSESARVDGRVPPAEATVFDAGDLDPLIRIGDYVGALAICADVGSAAHPQHAADRGATLYLAGMFVIPSEFDGEDQNLRGHATRHRMAVAAANFGCASGGLASAGRSTIWSESGDVIVRLDSSGSSVGVASRNQRGWRGTKRMLAPTTTTASA
jgi:predicted amidohydrolase